MIFGLIIAAGNQTRFDSDIPKSLVPLKNKTCLDYTINNMNIICDKVYVVCSKDKVKYFKSYNYIPIKSGLGCGDAVLKALEKLKFNEKDMCFIQWGDSIVEFNVYLQLKDNSKKINEITIAAKHENNPYVRLIPNTENKTVKVEFSKFGEVSGPGLHDLSVFYGNANDILSRCKEFKDKFFKEDHYEHKHGNEFNFLDIMNDTDIHADVLMYKYARSWSFNTKDEYEELLKKVDEWEHF